MNWSDGLVASQQEQGALYLSDALALTSRLPNEMFNLVYIDPPWNTGSRQTLHAGSYVDSFADYEAMLKPVLSQLHRITAPTGSVIVHLSPHESHYVKVWLDAIFGRSNFRNEIIWWSELGRYATKTWGWKHSTLLWFTKSDDYVFNADAIPTTTRKALKPGYPDTKPWVDVWLHTMSNTAKERTGYPSQKPLAILEPLVAVHSNPGDLCLDCFCGSGSFGVACVSLKRRTVLSDVSTDAVEVVSKRLGWEMEGENGGKRFTAVVGRDERRRG